MLEQDVVNILLVDDQPAKLLSYDVILQELGQNLIKASSGREALEQLLKTEVAVVLMDVCMPDLDGFELAAMIREHPRFQKTAIIFISAIALTDVDRLRGYEMGAVDYVPVPVIPDVLRAKVRIFVELFRKTRQLERVNAELEARVAARTAELEASTAELRRSEEGRSMALAAGKMGSWDWDRRADRWHWDSGQYQIFGVDEKLFDITAENIRALIHAEDWAKLQSQLEQLLRYRKSIQCDFRVKRPNGERRWCTATVTPGIDHLGRVHRISGVTLDITDRKLAEERQTLLAREVDHRAKNALALVQSIVRLTKAADVNGYVGAVEGRIRALSRAHTLLSQTRWEGADLRGLVDEELAPYRTADQGRIVTEGPNVSLQPAVAQSIALALHELATNAAKYGALSADTGSIRLQWDLKPGALELQWIEVGGPQVAKPASLGFGTRIITASVEGQLEGRTRFDWEPQGLRVSLTVPREDMTPVKGRNGAAVAETCEAPNTITVPGNRIMIVEDEALVGMALRDTLDQLGFSVLGPFGKVADALNALRGSSIDAAVLDVNLGGQVVYPLADVLVAGRIPFIFVTGYGSEELETRFASVPVLQKPIERDALKNTLVRGSA